MENYQVDVEGVIILVSEVLTGVRKNGDSWEKVSVVVKSEGKYPKELEVSIFGDLIQEFTEGQIIKLKCNAESRNHNGRYFTEVKAYKIL